MQGVTEVNASTFDQTVLKSNIPVVVDWYAPWCGPCRQLAPVIQRLAQEMAGKVVVVKINADDCMELAAEQQVNGLPTVMFYKGGEVKERRPGLSSFADLKACCEKLI